MSSSDITVKSVVTPVLPLKAANSSTVTTEDLPRVETVRDLPVVRAEEQNARTKPETESPGELSNAVENINKFVKNNHREIQFSVDEQTGRHIVKVIDFESKELIRQIPAEEVLEIARRLDTLAEETGNIIKTSA